MAAEVVLREAVGGADLPRQEAAAERAVGDEADPELAAGRRAHRPPGRASRASTQSAAPRSDARRARAGSSRARLRRGRGAEPCPLERAPPSRRPSPRSGHGGRRGAGSRDRCGRRRAAGARRRTPAARMRRRRGRSREPSSLANVAELRGEHDLVATVADRLAHELLVRDRGRTCRPCRGSRSRARARGGSSRSTRPRRSSRRTPTSPCSRGRARRPRAPDCRACVCP